MRKSKEQALLELSKANPGVAYCLAEDIKPMDLAVLPIEQRAVLEVLGEKFDAAPAVASEVKTITADEVDSRVTRIHSEAIINAANENEGLVVGEISHPSQERLAVATDINLETLSVEQLCTLEIIQDLIEAHEARGEPRSDFEIDPKQLRARVRAKKRELERTGYVSTTLQPGAFKTNE